jgi:hypothetical protein
MIFCQKNWLIIILYHDLTIEIYFPIPLLSILNVYNIDLVQTKMGKW